MWSNAFFILKISKDKTFSRLPTLTLKEASILEVSDLQAYIFNSPKEFCKELGEDLTIIGREVRPSPKTVGDKIDQLALDSQRNTVIIELKRGHDKLQLLQAIAYAAMIAKWTPAQILQLAGKGRTESITESIEEEAEEAAEEAIDDGEETEETEEAIEEADEVDQINQINEGQRVLLIAEEYDYEVLATAEWLYTKDVEIDCVRVSLAKDGDERYLTFTHVFPPPELAKEARIRHRRRTGGPVVGPVRSWEAALAGVTNQAVANFFRQQLDANRDNKPFRALIFPIGVLPAGNRAIVVKLTKRGLQQRFALVVQKGRFPGDIEFWSNRLQLRIPSDADQRSEVMAITIPI